MTSPMRETNGTCRPEAWQPIETAPRGKQVLVYDSAGDISIAILQPSVGKWLVLVDGGLVGIEVYSPTHWMPCPRPPAPEAEYTCEAVARAVAHMQNPGEPEPTWEPDYDAGAADAAVVRAGTGMVYRRRVRP